MVIIIIIVIVALSYFFVLPFFAQEGAKESATVTKTVNNVVTSPVVEQGEENKTPCPENQYSTQEECADACKGFCNIDGTTDCYYCAIGPCPDLTVTSVGASMNINKSGACGAEGCKTTCTLTSTVDVMVANAGQMAAHTSTTSVVVMSGDQILNAETLDTPRLDPFGFTDRMHLEMKYEKTADGPECPAEFNGPFQAIATADAKDSLLECSENNNEARASPQSPDQP